MGYNESRKAQNLYLLNRIKAKVLNFNNYDSKGSLKPEYALTEQELLVLKELGYDGAIKIFEAEGLVTQVVR